MPNYDFSQEWKKKQEEEERLAAERKKQEEARISRSNEEKARREKAEIQRRVLTKIGQQHSATVKGILTSYIQSKKSPSIKIKIEDTPPHEAITRAGNKWFYRDYEWKGFSSKGGFLRIDPYKLEKTITLRYSDGDPVQDSAVPEGTAYFVFYFSSEFDLQHISDT